MKESYTTIYDLLGTGKLPRKNNSYNTIHFKFQMIVMRLLSAFGRGGMVEIW